MTKMTTQLVPSGSEDIELEIIRHIIERETLLEQLFRDVGSKPSSELIITLDRIVRVTVLVVEAICTWRKVLKRPQPFMYSNRNYVLKLINDLDRLDNTKPGLALAKAYGIDKGKEKMKASEFKFKRNPFLVDGGLPAPGSFTPRTLERETRHITKGPHQRDETIDVFLCTVGHGYPSIEEHRIYSAQQVVVLEETLSSRTDSITSPVSSQEKSRAISRSCTPRGKRKQLVPLDPKVALSPLNRSQISGERLIIMDTNESRQRLVRMDQDIEYCKSQIEQIEERIKTIKKRKNQKNRKLAGTERHARNRHHPIASPARKQAGIRQRIMYSREKELEELKAELAARAAEVKKKEMARFNYIQRRANKYCKDIQKQVRTELRRKETHRETAPVEPKAATSCAQNGPRVDNERGSLLQRTKSQRENVFPLIISTTSDHCVSIAIATAVSNAGSRIVITGVKEEAKAYVDREINSAKMECRHSYQEQVNMFRQDLIQQLQEHLEKCLVGTTQRAVATATCNVVLSIACGNAARKLSARNSNLASSFAISAAEEKLDDGICIARLATSFVDNILSSVVSSKASAVFVLEETTAIRTCAANFVNRVFLQSMTQFMAENPV